MTTPTTGLDGLRERAEQILEEARDNLMCANDGAKVICGPKTLRKHIKFYRDLLTALSAAPQGAEGWVLVPREPTEAMIEAWRRYRQMRAPLSPLCEDAWAVMLAASPSSRPTEQHDPASPAPAQDAATGGEKPEKVWAREARQIACNLMDPTHSATASRNDAAFFLGYIANKLDTRTPSPDARELVENRRLAHNIVQVAIEWANAPNLGKGLEKAKELDAAVRDYQSALDPHPEQEKPQ